MKKAEKEIEKSLLYRKRDRSKKFWAQLAEVKTTQQLDKTNLKMEKI
jgi:hypothetical protein